MNLNGLKTEVKTSFINAFRAGLSDKFWHSLDASMKDVKQHVLEEFPAVKMEFPLVTVSVSFGTTNWSNLSRSFIVHQSQMHQTAEVDCKVSLDFFTMSSIQRDRLQDGYLYLLLFGYTKPDSLAFARALKQSRCNIMPILNSIAFGLDQVSNKVPWCQGVNVYTGSLSFDAKVVYSMDLGDILDVLKEIDVDVSPSE